MPLPSDLAGRLRLPLIAAPMFLVSGPELVISACTEGVIGSFPTANTRTPEELESWLQTITEELAKVQEAGFSVAPWAANILVHPTNPYLASDLDIVERFRAPIVITALGGPQRIVERVHAWGGKVFADVNSLEYARKAAASGVDGLILVAVGAGGHTGAMNGFSFVAAVREFFNGPLALAGGITNGASIRATEVAGADLAVMGTSFVATHESLAAPEYKQMLIDSRFEDLVLTDCVTNVPANWLRPTLVRAGLDPSEFRAKQKVDFGSADAQEARNGRWKTVWSAGHGVGSIEKVESVAELVDRLHQEYVVACEQCSSFAGAGVKVRHRGAGRCRSMDRNNEYQKYVEQPQLGD